jgi:ribosome-binding ATPase YchF (GTP1/OBG family)
MKKMVYLINVNDRDYLRNSFDGLLHIKEYVSRRSATEETYLLVSLLFEQKLKNLKLDSDYSLYTACNPTHVSILEHIIPACFNAVNMIHFYTYNNENSSLQCFCIRKGTTVEGAAAIVSTHLFR